MIQGHTNGELGNKSQNRIRVGPNNRTRVQSLELWSCNKSRYCCRMIPQAFPDIVLGIWFLTLLYMILGLCYAPSHLLSSSWALDLACSLLRSPGPARFGPLSPALSFLFICSYPHSWSCSPMHFMFLIFVCFMFSVPHPRSKPRTPIPVPFHFTSHTVLEPVKLWCLGCTQNHQQSRPWMAKKVKLSKCLWFMDT